MENSSEYTGFLIAFAASAAVALLMVGVHELLGKRNTDEYKTRPFECGVTPFEAPHGRFSVKFYLIAMLFILFDVEIVWFFPWAVALRDLGRAAFWEMLVFAAVLVLGFGYAWKKGALDWEK